MTATVNCREPTVGKGCCLAYVRTTVAWTGVVSLPSGDEALLFSAVLVTVLLVTVDSWQLTITDA